MLEQSPSGGWDRPAIPAGCDAPPPTPTDVVFGRFDHPVIETFVLFIKTDIIFDGKNASLGKIDVNVAKENANSDEIDANVVRNNINLDEFNINVVRNNVNPGKIDMNVDWDHVCFNGNHIPSDGEAVYSNSEMQTADDADDHGWKQPGRGKTRWKIVPAPPR